MKIPVRVLYVIAVVVILFGIAWAVFDDVVLGRAMAEEAAPSDASDDLQRRQVRALERMASALEGMRRDCD